MTTPRIAFLGIGLMGKPMVERLLQAGFQVTVWNRTAEKALACAEQGALFADKLSQAVSDADIVITMLESGPIVLDVITQAKHHIKRGAIVIDMSSTKQSEALALNSLLITQEITFVDAPVSGGVVGAEQGTLAIMVGASDPIFQRIQPLLNAMGTATLVGDVGSGQLAKLCNQLIVGGTLNLVAEALLLAQAGGANPAAVRQALRGGFAESRILEVHGQRMLERNFLPGGQVKSQAKDMENILDAANHAHLKLAQAELITAVYRRLLSSVPSADQSAALLDLEATNAGIRLGQIPDKLPT
ncbi:NAD(P)-dependent oxidoreductase [Sapientia aquatica]|uniref:NAD(P)-dependent oxidoreductase n=1 Tax=Sapientia aquatica TaxID=1549640 RepID=A0A4R5W2I2_9BURK|nr:NAD(P)-dependent oxidoreductase [Sapientia aquatica]TDK65373.1 NAD(P)-dependent oxidoreductase [Sapientia aquatica]